MTNEQVIIVKKSWKKLRTVNAELIGDVFYSKLFFDHPRLRKMFPASMQKQYTKLVDMLNFIIARMDNRQQMSEDIRSLGASHQYYNVRPEYYALVGDALIWTLARSMGKEWNPTIEQAWMACYKSITENILAAYHREI